jgi:hypothetical protein
MLGRESGLGMSRRIFRQYNRVFPAADADDEDRL